MEDKSVNRIIPKLLLKSEDYKKSFKKRIKINNIFTEFDHKANDQLRNFINESKKRYKGIKSGNHLDTLVRNSSEKYETFAKKILTDNFYVNLNIDKEKEVPLIETMKANARKLAVSFVNVHLGLNKTVQELGITDYSTFILEKADTTEQFKLCHELGGAGYIIANALNTVIPDCSPPGTSHLSITCAVYGEKWADVKPQDYKKTKLKIAKKMINLYENS